MHEIRPPVDPLYPHIPLLLYVIALVWLLIRLIQSIRPKQRPDLPSSIEITGAGSLQLFHGQEPYAEIQMSQISSLKDVVLDVLPWNTVNASELILKTTVQGVDHIYILPHLHGYSEFILKLTDASPSLVAVHKSSEWGSIPSGSLGLALGMLSVFAVVILIAVISLSVNPHLRGHSHAADLLIIWSLKAIIIAALFLTAREARGRVTNITFSPDKMQIMRSSIWYSDVRPDEIDRIELVQAENRPEYCMIWTRKGGFRVSSEYLKSYPGLVRRIRQFAGELSDSIAV